jgi:hypothetical protein
MLGVGLSVFAPWAWLIYAATEKYECNPLKTRIVAPDLMPEVKQYKTIYHLFFTEASFENLKGTS